MYPKETISFHNFFCRHSNWCELTLRNFRNSAEFRNGIYLLGPLTAESSDWKHFFSLSYYSDCSLLWQQENPVRTGLRVSISVYWYKPLKSVHFYCSHRLYELCFICFLIKVLALTFLIVEKKVDINGLTLHCNSRFWTDLHFWEIFAFNIP